ncbi:adenylosuccinate synthetase [Acinetobacter phage DMU1]|nr:adenylosuccinate synthetase [Acinetobacter phage DMU1]
MKKATVICDMQFGSTGKGLIAGFLAERDQPDVVVTAWSANAGHTYINREGRKWVHCMLANGIVSPKLKAVLIGGGSQMSIPTLISEIMGSLDILQGKSILIHENACIIQQRHVEEEAGPMTKIGSTKKGCGAAMMEKIRRNPESKIVAKDFIDDGLEIPDFKLDGTVGFKDISRHFEELGVCIKVVSNEVYLSVLHKAERVQVEGAQGFSLGLHNGFYPYVTSRECTPAQICSDCNVPISMVDKVVGTMRTYPIRVANRYDEDGKMVGWSGPCYSDQTELTWEQMGVTPEKTTVTKLTRRIFSFSRMQTRQAMQVCMPDEIFLNFANYCASEDELTSIIEVISNEGGDVSYIGWGDSAAHIESMLEGDWSDDTNPLFNQYNKSLNIA